jgi:tetratricopeptide (TPR) repeat protein
MRQRLGEQRITYVEGHCLAYGSVMPYLPVLDLLRDYCGIAEGDRPETLAAKVCLSLQQGGLDPDVVLPYLLNLLGVPVGADRFAGLSTEALKARTFETLQHLFLNRGWQQPLVLAVENLHWIDPTSEAFLASLVERLAGVPVLLLATFRPGYRPPWLDKSYATQIALQSLGPDDSRQVVRSVLRTTPLSPALEQQLLAKAEGNPFFLEELAQTVVEQGGRQPSLVVPDTIQAVLAARIDRLPDTAKGLLQAASVIGKEVPLRLLLAITALPEEAVRYNLVHLQAGEFLYETRLVPEHVYTFKHALTHDVAYRSLGQAQRRAWHRQVVAALEALAADGRPDQIEHLAHHAMQGELWDQALTACRQAGAKAMARSAQHEAVLCYEQALHALQHLPPQHETRQQAIDLHLELRNALVPLGEFTRIFAHLREAEALAGELGDSARQGRIAAYLARDFNLTGDHERAIASGQRALTLIREDFALQVATYLYLSYAYHAVGAHRQGLTVLRQVVASFTGALNQERLGLAALPAVSTRVSMVYCLTELGEFREACSLGEEALHIATAAAHPFSLTQAYRGLGRLYVRQGAFDQAIVLLERCLALCLDADLPLAFPVVAAYLGSAYALSGRLPEALPLLQQAVAQGNAIQLVDQQALRLVLLGEGYLLADRLSDAVPLAQEALALARTRRERGAQGYALRLLGALAAHAATAEASAASATTAVATSGSAERSKVIAAARPEAAENAYQQAIALADDLGMRPLLAYSYVGLGTLYSRLERREPARAALSAAIALCQAMDMTFWLSQAQAALAHVE